MSDIPPFNEWSPEGQDRTMRAIRNHLSDEQKKVYEAYRQSIAQDLTRFLGEYRSLIMETPRKNLHRFGSFLNGNLLMAVRNEYELWLPEHPVTAMWHESEKLIPLNILIHQVDDHPCHPDQFSFKILERVWDILQETKDKTN